MKDDSDYKPDQFNPVRLLTDHLIDPANVHSGLRITVMDEPGSGGANHRYVIGNYDATSNPSLDPDGIDAAYPQATVILFQNGPIGEVGTNGVTHEALLAIVADRLESFQTGPYACGSNASALHSVKMALYQLQSRTRDRQARGVEGTHTI
jgi:hypothetical protein